MPVEPSMDTMSPSLITSAPTEILFCHTPLSMASQPQTQGLPMPRATTAAWLVMPPRLVRMPWAAYHAVDVVRGGFRADQQHLLPGLGQLLGVIGVKDDRAGGGARGGRQAFGDDLELGLGVDLAVEKFVQLGRLDHQDGLPLGDQGLLAPCRRRF